MKSRLLPIAAAALAACGDPTSLRARFETVEVTLTAYALTGTPVSVPTALNTPLYTVVRADPSVSYDVVFDIGDDGRVVLYPAPLVTGSGRVGIRKIGGTFEALRRAPDDGYEESQPTVVGVGEVVAIRAFTLYCANDFRQDIYSKLVVTAIDASARTITFRLRVDPNCGFRELTEGVPNS